MSAEPDQPSGVYTVHLERTIGAVREALPADERAEFAAVIDSIAVVELPSTFEYWYRRAVLAQVPGLAERIAAGTTGPTVPIQEVIPDWDTRLAAHRAGRHAA
jgi:hypothetical protein